jgi:hypothetical protein
MKPDPFGTNSKIPSNHLISSVDINFVTCTEKFWDCLNVYFYRINFLQKQTNDKIIFFMKNRPQKIFFYKMFFQDTDLVGLYDEIRF